MIDVTATEGARRARPNPRSGAPSADRIRQAPRSAAVGFGEPMSSARRHSASRDERRGCLAESQCVLCRLAHMKRSRPGPLQTDRSNALHRACAWPDTPSHNCGPSVTSTARATDGLHTPRLRTSRDARHLRRLRTGGTLSTRPAPTAVRRPCGGRDRASRSPDAQSTDRAAGVRCRSAVIPRRSPSPRRRSRVAATPRTQPRSRHSQD